MFKVVANSCSKYGGYIIWILTRGWYDPGSGKLFKYNDTEKDMLVGLFLKNSATILILKKRGHVVCSSTRLNTGVRHTG